MPGRAKRARIVAVVPVWVWSTVGVALITAAISALVWRRRRDATYLLLITAATLLIVGIFQLPAGPALSLAVYGGIAAMVMRRSRREVPRAAAVLLGLGLPAAVTWWEIEYGDATTNELIRSLVGALLVLVVFTYLWVRLRPTRTPSVQGPTQPRKIVAVLNPSKFGDAGEALLRELYAQAVARGLPPPELIQTTREDSGVSAATAAAALGADLVIACGGDGTVRACADGLATTGVPLGIVPAGTGNLLCRNLGIPLDLGDAVAVALTGVNRVIDLGRVNGQRFAVMAGIGFDAAMVAGASERLKQRVGWPAYFVAGVRHLLGDIMKVKMSVDDEAPFQRRARLVLIGNVGRIQGGIPLLPDAAPDDGQLDVVVLAPRGLVDWIRVAVNILTRRRGANVRIERFRAKKVSIKTERPHPRELDGETISVGTTLDAEIEPAALVVRVPG
jgi:YegS/Rv2252/BmrU family lipid kinase